VKYSISTPSALGGSPAPRPCLRLGTWLRCRQCHHGYCAAGAPQPCPACTGGRLLPMTHRDLCTEVALSGMLARPVAQEGRL
jgi:hypothetical protein